MALKAGEGFVDLLPNFKEAEFRAVLSKKLDAAGKLAGTSFQNAFSGKLKAAGELLKANPELVGAGIVAGLAVAVKKIADETANYAGEVRGLELVSGASAEGSSRLVAIFHDLGIETSTAARPLATLADQIYKGGGRLKDFFSSAELARFKSQDLSKTLLEVGDRYKQLSDPIKRDELAMAALGKRGLGLTPVLAKSREELEKMGKNAERAGLIFSDKQISDALRYQISLRELGDTFKGLEVQVGKVVIPGLANAAENIREVILGAEDAGHKAGSALGFLPKPLKDVAGLSERVALDFATIGAAELFRRHTKDGKELKQTLDQIETSATSDKDAAKQMDDLFKQAFSDINSAADAFDKRLDALIPKLGETFQNVKIGSVDTSAEGQAAAADKLKSAQDRLANAEDHLAKVRTEKKRTSADIAAAERSISRARDDVTRATDGVTKAHVGLSDALERTLRDNAGKTSRFASDLDSLNQRFARIATRGGEQVEQSFLSHLADLGPGAVPLLDDLLRKSDGKLGDLAGIFGDQISAAKKAADFQFDKYPANFAQKIAAARTAAIGEGQKLIDEFNALGDNPQLQEKLGDQITGVAQLMQLKLGPSLSKAQLGLLHVAQTGDTAAQKVSALQQFLDGLKSKSVDVKVNIFENIPSTDPLALLLAGGTGTPTHRASGGSVLAGRDYLVGEDGPELLRMGRSGTSGAIVPNRELVRAAAGGTDGPIVLHATFELDGEVLARKTVRHNGRAAEAYRRERA